MYRYPPCMHIIYLVILTCSFKMAAILVFCFDLLSCLYTVVDLRFPIGGVWTCWGAHGPIRGVCAPDAGTFQQKCVQK